MRWKALWQYLSLQQHLHNHAADIPTEYNDPFKDPHTHPNTMASTDKKEQRWFPLESNPTLMNDYIQKWGFDTSKYQFYDVFSTEDWALDMIPQPVSAVIMLYPLTPPQLAAEKGRDHTSPDADKDSAVWFIRQRIGNACGTIGLLHAIQNASPPQTPLPDSWWANFQQQCPTNLDPIAKAAILEGDTQIAQLHEQATSSDTNATSRGSLEDRVLTHFVALVHVQGHLFELDGRQTGPLSHGPTSPKTLLKDACAVVRQFMDRDPGEVRFTILALAPTTTSTGGEN